MVDDSMKFMRREVDRQASAEAARLNAQAELFTAMGFSTSELTIVCPPCWQGESYVTVRP